jgi:long-chain fatty acid transport protein
MRNFRHLFLSGVAGAALIGAVSSAQAGGFALREQSAVGLGNSFAGAAAGGSGLGSMFWNPATMTNFAGIQSSLALFAILPNSKITPTSGTSSTLQLSNGLTDTGDMAQDAVIPASYGSYQVNENVWLGLSINTPFGLVTQNPNNWAGQIFGRTSKVMSLNATPTLAYRFNDQFSLAAGVQIMHFKVRLTQATGVTTGASSATLEGDDIAFGYTLGATYKPMPGTEIGIGYRSQVKPKLEGTLTTTAATDIHSDLTLPDQVTVGLRQTITDEFTLLAGFEWTHWSKFTRFPVLTTSGATATTLVFDYKDGWYASLGGEYKLNRDWTLRAGLGFEHSPINNENRSVRLPDSNRTWTSIGATYALNDQMSFDVSYAHLFAKSGTITSTSSGLTLNADTKGRVDIFAIGLNFKLGAEPKKTATRAAMITK